MVFSSAVFLFLFLPVFLLVYYLLPFEKRSAWILLASYAFYGWWRVDFMLLFVATTVLTYVAGRLVGRFQDVRPGRARLALAAGIIGNLGVLAYFKYFNFGIDSLNALLVRLGGDPLGAWRVILPIGISFYVFQAVSYLVDVYRRDAPGDSRFIDVAAYIALFPQLIAGPILRYKDLAAQFRERSHTFDKFSEGSLRFMVGLCKKVLIADGVAPLADAAFALAEPSFADAWLGALAFAVQLYFDFSGYSDMAIGLGLMMGFRFRENFDHPYVSRTITEFWRRWHISLSTWLRDYLYIPLGGNRRGRARTYVNLMMVMLLGGLWHGAAWTFVLWGAWHGGLLMAERYLRERALPVALPAFLAVLRTLVFVLVGWVTFRAADFGGALAVYAGMLGLNGWAVSDALSWQLGPSVLVTLAAAWLLVFLAPWWRQLVQSTAGRWAWPPRLELAVLPFFLLGVMRVLADSFSPFLYFRF